MKTYFAFILAIFAVALLDLSQASRGPGSSCSRHYQCSVGRCVKYDNVLCGVGNFIGNLFGGKRRRRQKTCSTWKCGECTRNSHCGWNQYCSGYKCYSNPTYNSYDNNYGSSNNYGSTFASSSSNNFGSSNNNYGSSSNNYDYGTSYNYEKEFKQQNNYNDWKPPSFTNSYTDNLYNDLAKEFNFS